MIHPPKTLSRLAGMAMLAAGVVAFGASKAPTQLRPLAGSVLPAVGQSLVVGAPSPSQQLAMAIALNPSNLAGLEAFADSVSDPNSPNYRHFATPEQVASQFGASQADVNNVVAYVTSKGMSVTLVDRDHLAVIATGTVAQAQAAFGTTIKMLKGPDANGNTFTYEANTTPIEVPSNIANVVHYVSGLNTYLRPKPRTTLTPALARALYNTAPSFAAGFTGSGASIGISNWDGFKISNAGLFISYFGLPVPPGGSMSNIHVVSVYGSNNNTNGGGEGDLDIQMELATAPLADIYVYDSTSYDPLLTLTKEASDNVSDIVSESWGWSGISGAYADSVHAQHLAMTSHGQTYLCASGDSGTADLSNYPYPDVDPDVTNVGGTIATVNGSGQRTSEVGWSGSGGGWSTAVFGTTNFNVKPSWQHGTGVPNKNYRLVPDVALHSQSGNNQAYYFFYGGSEYYVAGTSCASPLCTGALATVGQRLVANGQSRRFGRINDLLYSQNGRSDVWYDITSGSNGTLPDGTAGTAGPGWDFVTGWGAPNFDGFYTAIATQTITPSSFSLFRGILLSGDLASLATIDKNYLVAQLGVTLNPAESPIQFILNGTSGVATPSKLELDLTGHTSTVGLTQVVEAYNWTTSQYVQVDSRATSKSDTTLKLTISNPTQLIQSGTNAVKARVRYFASGPTQGFPWSASIDQAIWRVTP